jgi:hypothetical protein
VAEFGDIAMMRKMLLGIKSRAEAGPADGKAHGDDHRGTDGEQCAVR